MPLSRVARARLLSAALLAMTMAPAAAGAAVPGAEPPSLPAPPACTGGCVPLGEPGSPGDDGPVALGRSGAPDDDLAAALDALASAPTAAAAQSARAEAIAILEGRPLAGRAYSGIPLLNWNAPAKVRAVPAGGTVDVREVRFGGHSLSDTWLLEFADPDAPYTIRFHVTELGEAFGGELKPTPLLADGAEQLGGLHSLLTPLAPPPLPMGTRDTSRFTAQRGIPSPGAPELTRLATQPVTVRMPPPRLTRAILDPATRPNAPSLLTLHPATPERVDAAAAALGFRGPTPSEAEKRTAIERLAVAAPERQLWGDLDALPGPDEAGFLAAARAVGAQDRELVDAMRTRTALPAGVAADPEADVTVVLQNGEAYVSSPRLHLPPATPVRVQVVNRDGFAHRFEPLALHGREAVLGPDDWGRFDWSAPAGGELELEPGGSRTVTLPVADDAFALWLGDPGAGDQAAAVVELDRGPRTQSATVDADDAATPLHAAADADGDLWITLEGVDTVVELSPAPDLAASRRTRVRLPGGAHSVASDRPPLGPSDVAIDEHGIAWVTLALGNAIARIDPAATADGTDRGVRIYPLAPCGHDECAVPFVPDPGERETREPLQMEVTSDARGNTVVWFTEAAADRIGALRVAPDGTPVGETHFTCGCTAPLGLALDAGGDVWFTEGVTSRIGRLTPDETSPFAAAGARLRHYKVPSAVLVTEPELSRLPVLTANPHSVAVDARGLVWFTEAATGKLGVLDPEAARPGTEEGMTELDLPPTPFGAAAAPADLAVDRAGTVLWADEYGDAVGTVDARGLRASWRPGPTIRPTARRSLTDSPVMSPAGELFFLESGAGLLTRVSDVTAGAPPPGAAPRVELDTSAGAVEGSGLQEADAVEVGVERGGRVVAGERVPVRAGGFRWLAGAPDALRSGDVVRLTPRGAHPRATLSFTVPGLRAGLRAGGGAAGSALRGGVPLADRVLLDGVPALVNPQDGSFGSPAGAPRSVTWTQATPGAVYTVRSAVLPAASAEPAPDAPPLPSEPPAPAAGPPPLVAPVAPSSPPVLPAPAADPPSRAGRACPQRWLTGSRRRPKLALLGGRPKAACAGRRGLRVTVRDGRVVAFTLTGPGWTSARGGLGVGAPRRSIRVALPGARRTGPRSYRALLALGGGRVAEVRIRADRRVRRIAVRETTRQRRDRASAPETP